MNEMIRGMDKDKLFRFIVTDTREVVEKARAYHDTVPTATAALGRLLTAGLMMGYTMKNKDEKLTLKINGGGPVGTLLVTADNLGHVKGYIQNPKFYVEDKPNKKLNVGKAVGTDGNLRVIRNLGLKEPYIGESQLVSGEIGDDIASYYFNSEQQPTVIGLGVLIDRDISVKAAGGFMIQAMPDLKEEDLARIEKQALKINNLSKYFEKDKKIEDIAKEIISDFEINITEKISVEYRCDCSKERTEEALISLGKDEIDKMINEDGSAEVVCQFCNKKYLFKKEDLEKIMTNI